MAFSSARSHDELSRISKSMSWLLRHGAQKEGLSISSDGYVLVSDLLAHRNLVRMNVTRDLLDQIVQDDAKGRYQFDTSGTRIRATQGHSIALDDIEKDYSPLTADNLPPVVVHGTYSKNLESIQRDGLKRFSRMFIHCAVGLPGDKEVLSGMRNDVDTVIYIDVARAMADGIPFFLSPNKVVLTPGVDGTLPPKYFQRIESRSRKRS